MKTRSRPCKRQSREATRTTPSSNFETSYNEALIYDALGKYDQATGVLTEILASSAHTEGKYSEQERGNRDLFLERLGTIYREENKTAEAVAAYKEMVDLGGDYAASGYPGESLEGLSRDAHQWKEATAAASCRGRSRDAQGPRRSSVMYARANSPMSAR